MKPKEFIQKYGIENGWNPKHQNNFIQDLSSIRCSRIDEDGRLSKNGTNEIRFL